jgi:mono/diheme cytochrome c family protein
MRIAMLLFAATAAFCGQDEVSAGAKIFRSHCAECHGLKGQVVAAKPLDRRLLPRRHRRDLMNNISDGIPGTAMPGFSSRQSRSRI